MQKRVKCGVCLGTRSFNGTPPSRCWTCYGKGFTITKNGPYIEEDVCFKCKGSGVTIKQKCQNCDGEGLVTQNVYERVKISANDGEEYSVEFSHKGHESVNSHAGRLIVKVRVTPHTVFTRKKLDVYSTVCVPYHVGILGGSIAVETLTGSHSIQISPFMSHDSTHKLSIRGLRGPNPGSIGDHYINFILQAPLTLTEEERQLYSLLDAKE